MMVVFLPFFEVFEIIFSEWSRSFLLMLSLFLLMMLLLRMDKLLLTFKVLSSHDLARITNLVVVLIVFMLLNTLTWLPTTCFSFISASSFVFKSLTFLLHHLMLLRISHLRHSWKLWLLLLIRRWIVNDMLWRHYKSLRHHHLVWHHLSLHNWLARPRYKLASTDTYLWWSYLCHSWIVWNLLLNQSLIHLRILTCYSHWRILESSSSIHLTLTLNVWLA